MVATDNSGSVTLTSNYQSGGTFPIGDTNVVYTATDPSGNFETASFKLTVQGIFMYMLTLFHTTLIRSKFVVSILTSQYDNRASLLFYFFHNLFCVP